MTPLLCGSGVIILEKILMLTFLVKEHITI